MSPKKDDERDDEEVTLTKAELKAMLDERDKTAKMGNEERRIRSIIREEVEGAMRKSLPGIFEGLFEDEPGDKQKPGDTGKGLLRSFLGE